MRQLDPRGKGRSERNLTVTELESLAPTHAPRPNICRTECALVAASVSTVDYTVLIQRDWQHPVTSYSPPSSPHPYTEIIGQRAR